MYTSHPAWLRCRYTLYHQLNSHIPPQVQMGIYLTFHTSLTSPILRAPSWCTVTPFMRVQNHGYCATSLLPQTDWIHVITVIHFVVPFNPGFHAQTGTTLSSPVLSTRVPLFSRCLSALLPSIQSEPEAGYTIRSGFLTAGKFTRFPGITCFQRGGKPFDFQDSPCSPSPFT